MQNWMFLLLLPIGLFAQKVTISEPITLRNDLRFDIIGEMGGHTLIFRSQPAGYSVLALNAAMKESWTKELELDKRVPRLLDLVPGQNHFTLIYQFKDRANTILKAHRYGPGANLLDSVTLLNMGPVFSNPNFQFARSDDRSKSVIVFTEKQDQLRALCFDHDEMRVLWDALITPQDFNYYQDYQGLLVDNDGNMTIITEKYNYRSKREEHHFEFFHYRSATGMLMSFILPMPNLLTYDARFTVDHLNQRLVGSGLYAEKNLGTADGYFYLNIDPSRPDVRTFENQPFDEPFTVTILGKDAERYKGIPDMALRETVLRKDGGLLLIGERKRTSERSPISMNRNIYDASQRFAIDYYHDEIFVLSVHPTGLQHWATVMHKKQYSQDDDGVYSSFFLFKTAANLRFLFNDEVKYENTVSEYVLKGNGRFVRNSLLSTENLKLRLRFRDAIQVNSGTLLIPSERRNRLKLVRLEYD